MHRVELSGATNGADILTDLLITSIPILLLRKSWLRLGQKLRILVFLNLSLFMIAFALARLLGPLYRDKAGVLTISFPWIHAWLHFESSVAVLMGGLTVFRVVFASHIREAGQRRTSNITPPYKRFKARWVQPSGKGSSGHPENHDAKPGAFLPVPLTGATLKGLRTLIRNNRRERGHTTLDTGGSILDSKYDPLESYHHYVKEAHFGAAPRADSRKDVEIQVRLCSIIAVVSNNLCHYRRSSLYPVRCQYSTPTILSRWKCNALRMYPYLDLSAIIPRRVWSCLRTQYL